MKLLYNPSTYEFSVETDGTFSEGCCVASGQNQDTLTRFIHHVKQTHQKLTITQVQELWINFVDTSKSYLR